MKTLVTIGAACCALGGCSTLGTLSPYKMGHALNGEYFEVDAVWRGRFTAAPPADRPALSREYAYYLISKSDRKCEDYLVGISAGNNAIGGSLDLLSMGLNLAGAGASSLGSANDLAAGAGGFQSLRTAAQKTLFAGSEFSVIYQAVHKGRDAERTALITAIDAGRLNTWGPEAIAMAINAYDVKCGVNYAARIINNAVATAQAPTASTPLPALVSPH